MSPKDERIHIRLTANERKLLQKAAEKAGYSNVSAYIRAVTIGDEQGFVWPHLIERYSILLSLTFFRKRFLEEKSLAGKEVVR